MNCVVTEDAKVYWNFRIRSYEGLIEYFSIKGETAQVSILPVNTNWISPSGWEMYFLKRPAWFSAEHRSACWNAFAEWKREFDSFMNYKKIINPLIDIRPPSRISEGYIKLLKDWAHKGRAEAAWMYTKRPISIACDSQIWFNVRDTVLDTLGGAVRRAIMNSLGYPPLLREEEEEDDGGPVLDAEPEDWTRYAIGMSVMYAEYAYLASFFRLPSWHEPHLQEIQREQGVGPSTYPFRSLVKLWESGLVPSFDNETWRLHGGPEAKVLFELKV